MHLCTKRKVPVWGLEFHSQKLLQISEVEDVTKIGFRIIEKEPQKKVISWLWLQARSGAVGQSWWEKEGLASQRWTTVVTLSTQECDCCGTQTIINGPSERRCLWSLCHCRTSSRFGINFLTVRHWWLDIDLHHAYLCCLEGSSQT
jgi:hypothetical protein